jgi:hypothetical protein
VRQSVYICGIGENGLTKGWVCGVVDKNSVCLGSSTGPHTKEVWTSIELGCAANFLSLMGTSDHLCRV